MLLSNCFILVNHELNVNFEATVLINEKKKMPENGRKSFVW